MMNTFGYLVSKGIATVVSMYDIKKNSSSKKFSAD